ncbi:DUF6261 family protein [Parabacteroides distasonis]|jgi:hypothetical protein|uniref:DUF6261 family protein n=1 Tax=Parabacteroides distasonis TaxID=823 RepID=A0AAX3QQV4_PARDI|nr:MULTISPECIES: DUF6261 family protein [Parabacteroides]MCS2556955.1 DUF6261 family protein [Parabacteroides distasonis]MDB9028352.1 DUF6261 family protein [Parabacteroides distasonis]MDB9073863.1 DUF6261 family protein [Parabacteroides distasonis]RKU61590.1 hypothetical protein DWX33_06105 [Parabacteroides sp. AF19-14]WET65081.1 DUF6261 family protein [Parabacteroides distasonis]
MEKITKVKDINITKLNNAEYRTFMARYGNLLAGGGGDSESPDEISFDPNDPLGIPQELRTAFATDFALLTDAVNQSSASEETAQMSALDKERDDLLIFITSTITQMTKSPLAAQRTAAEKLYLPVKPYIGAARLANLQETAAIEGLLVDLDKAGMPEALAAINLTEVVAALKEKNKQYATLTEQRANAKADDPLESAKKIRLRMDEEYDEMSTYAFAQSVVKPTQETAAFISRLNALVDEMNALYNQRIAQARAAAAKKQEGDKPATDSDSPSEI